MGISYVYLVMCSDGTIYTGYTTDLLRRMNEHKNGTGAKWVKCHGFVDYVSFECPDHRTGRILEKLVKRVPKSKKIEIYGDIYIRESYLHKLMEMVKCQRK